LSPLLAIIKQKYWYTWTKRTTA